MSAASTAGGPPADPAELAAAKGAHTAAAWGTNAGAAWGTSAGAARAARAGAARAARGGAAGANGGGGDSIGAGVTGVLDAGSAGAAAPRRLRRGFAVAVVDAGVGNLGNVERALAHLGAAVEITREPRRVAAARCLVLPGVGAFAPPRAALRGPLEGALREALAAGAWLLGICVGFQLLFESSEEFGPTDGLGLLAGRITRLPAGVPVPHIGWNRLHDLAAHPLLAGLGGGEAGIGGRAAGAAAGGRQAKASGEASGVEKSALAREAGGGASGAAGAVGENASGLHFYFVHSFAPQDVPAETCLARATHGRSFPAVAGRGRVLGTQFHPERSGAAGLRLLANFMEIADGAAAGH